ncbi:MAG: hypothetical protein ACYTG1_09270, partial [Planctomycetota bacterium]
RLGAHVVVAYAYEGRADAVKDEYVARRAAELGAAGIDVTVPPARSADVHDEPPWDQITGLARRSRCDLVVVDAPYLDDYTRLGDGSVGTNLQMLMSRCPVPLLVIRAPAEAPASCLEEVVVPVGIEAAENVAGARWALRLVRGHGRLRILAVVDRGQLDAAGERLRTDVDLDAIDDDQLAGLHRPATAGLIAALQRRAVEVDLGCRVAVREGSAVEAVTAVAGERQALIALSCPRDPAARAYQRVEAIVRASACPVLVV